MLEYCANHAFVNQEEVKEAETGLRISGITTLEFGYTLFRFVSRADFRPVSCASSPWWFQSNSVRNIMNDARDSRRSIAMEAKENAAVADAWLNSCQYLLIAKVYYPLKCFYGPPRVVGKTSKHVDLSGLPDKADISNNAYDDVGLQIPDYSVEQLYIPGLNINAYDNEDKASAVRRVAKLVNTSLKIRPQIKLGAIPGIAEGGVEGMIHQLSNF